MGEDQYFWSGKKHDLLMLTPLIKYAVKLIFMIGHLGTPCPLELRCRRFFTQYGVKCWLMCLMYRLVCYVEAWQFCKATPVSSCGHKSEKLTESVLTFPIALWPVCLLICSKLMMSTLSIRVSPVDVVLRFLDILTNDISETVYGRQSAL